MVDSRRGARLELDTQAGTVTAPGRLADPHRARRRPARGLYEGGATLAPRGRSTTATVPALHQVTSQYGGLPTAPTALALRTTPTSAQLVQRPRPRRRRPEHASSRACAAPTASCSSPRPPAPRRRLRRLPLQSDRGEQALSLAVAEAAQGSGRDVPPSTPSAARAPTAAPGASWPRSSGPASPAVNAQLGRALDVDEPTTVTSAVGPAVDPGQLPLFPTLPPTPSVDRHRPPVRSARRPVRPRGRRPADRRPVRAAARRRRRARRHRHQPAPARPRPPPRPRRGEGPGQGPLWRPAPTPAPTSAPLLQVGGLKVG